ncbi:hypothetical protein V1514DRAFT_212184 [Lipomyces japonicus]|uniref:uncharacterized protein n=1 Tax=Lipomyces japonicus TaxID=56871 RepID=UPI0034CDD86C
MESPTKRQRVATNVKAQRGTYENGEWKCDCIPRRVAVLRTTLKEGANKGRKFYTCTNARDEQCKFFLWQDDAKMREQSYATSSPTKNPISHQQDRQQKLRQQQQPSGTHDLIASSFYPISNRPDVSDDKLYLKDGDLFIDDFDDDLSGQKSPELARNLQTPSRIRTIFYHGEYSPTPSRHDNNNNNNTAATATINVPRANTFLNKLMASSLSSNTTATVIDGTQTGPDISQLIYDERDHLETFFAKLQFMVEELSNRDMISNQEINKDDIIESLSMENKRLKAELEIANELIRRHKLKAR